MEVVSNERKMLPENILITLELFWTALEKAALGTLGVPRKL